MTSYAHTFAGAATAVVAPMLPGPTREEWGSAVVGLAVLLVRELVYWVRNRRRG